MTKYIKNRSSFKRPKPDGLTTLGSAKDGIVVEGEPQEIGILAPSTTTPSELTEAEVQELFKKLGLLDENYRNLLASLGHSPVEDSLPPLQVELSNSSS